MENKLKLDINKAARATVAIAASYALGRVSKGIKYPQLAFALTTANKKLAGALSKARLTSPLAATPGAPKPVPPTNTTFPGNYCWTHGHQCSQIHTSTTCGNKAAGHKDDATAANTMGDSDPNKG
jgi:hypothetical protein